MEVSEPGFTLLIVDDELQMRRLVGSIFEGAPYRLLFAESGRAALAAAAENRVDALLVDLMMPEMDGLTVLREFRQRYPAAMALMMTGQGGVREAVEAIRLGAVDFLEKPFAPEGLQARVGQMHRVWELNRENRVLKNRLRERFGYEGLVGNSTVMLKLKETIAQVGPAEATILIQGETGTGKELVARAIHYHSPRSARSFVPVDCGAISETVIESELFGHVKGAFTGAHVSTLGLFRSADGGTLFLDEIGDLSPAIQVKLLRTIQEREVRPVGDSRAHPVNVRILGATHRDLHREVAEGRFREDLFFRLNVLTLNVPPLRDRGEDVALLAKSFLKRFAAPGCPVQGISPAAMGLLQRHRWPGNVRELENVIRRAMALGGLETIQPEDLPESICPRGAGGECASAPAAGDTLEAYEIAAIRNALAKCGNNRSRAARLLGIGEATLYRKIKRYRIGAPDPAPL
jgi:DNA-binding NtrC family response regulator